MRSGPGSAHVGPGLLLRGELGRERVNRVLVAADPLFQEHSVHPGHPESPQRLAALEPVFQERRLPRIAVRDADDAEILALHSAAHLRRLTRLSEAGGGPLDADTALGPESLRVARAAAAATIDLALALAQGEADGAFAAVRPPGHHATRDRAMGFCVLNNTALAAEALRARGVRVAVFDWDVHHGNGTQEAFYASSEVLVASMHQRDHYPHTGEASELGEGEGLGANWNVPLPAGCRDADYLYAFDRLVETPLRAFQPEALLISAGFDPHRLDPLGGMAVTTEGFRALLRKARAAAGGAPTLLVLEGGYALDALAESTAACLDELAGAPADLPEQGRPHPHVVGLVDRIAREWGERG